MKNGRLILLIVAVLTFLGVAFCSKDYLEDVIIPPKDDDKDTTVVVDTTDIDLGVNRLDVLVSGKWELKSVIVNGQESFELMDSYGPIAYKFEKEQSVKIYINDELVKINSWAFLDNETKLMIINLVDVPQIYTIKIIRPGHLNLAGTGRLDDGSVVPAVYKYETEPEI